MSVDIKRIQTEVLLLEKLSEEADKIPPVFLKMTLKSYVIMLKESCGLTDFKGDPIDTKSNV